MRYLIAESQSQEISARCEYLYDIFGLYFIQQNKIDGFIPLVPIGTAEPSVLFIIGHQNQVMSFLKQNISKLNEKTLVMVTCMASSFKPFHKFNKRMYFSTANKELSYRYTGSDYGFKFDITKSELDFYNSPKKDILERLDDTFILL